MNNSSDLQRALQSLIAKWQGLPLKTAEITDYARGLLDGYLGAARELETLLETENPPMPELPDPDEASLVITPENKSSEPAYDYFYVSFEQAADGVWRVKHINGIWQPDWQSNLPFDEAVRRLSQQGWKLARFANGIHIFRREKSF